ncbi:protein fem-1 homolog B isoform X2 [Tribolium castaneum]|uniref:Protein fem-1 homolog B n=1 Tax=Tribolium castaneum TaxID=7070 RepID=D6WRB1_TRICA|nr:PREDICTED: protein fem-1 homolog B isoform X2 [Tribolium castaneum]EFA05982.1 Protein fem-1 homolog B-like Protein [Tribolium castaneum]|eukprot:XP_008195966.1 PREDICTED: protein fem-1 homolog B isoform X2 [Tribolium castaneum]
MQEPRDHLKNRVYYAAKDGMSLALYALLVGANKQEVEAILDEKFVEDDGQECTPLIVAARQGHDKVMRMMLTKFKPDLEKEGTVKFDGYVIEGASALWCAACAGHLNVVKTLVKAGADVNHPTKSNSTPLRAACFDGRLDIVKYLTYHRADINIANKYNNTCLMIAAYKGHLDVVSFLLEHGANANEKALCGATALHFAAECGHLPVVKELLKYNAVFSTNDSGMTPIKAAAERTRADVVEYLVERPEISKEEQIEALELLGASYANDKENYDIVMAYKYLHRSMMLRYSDPDSPVKKKLITPIPAYEHWVESQTVYELEAIQNNHNSIHMEALTIRERILGSQNPEVPHPVIYRGAVFADNARFERCLELWLHALRLRQKNHISVVKDLLRFAQVFSQMLHVNVKVTYDHVVQVLAAAITELERNKYKLSKPGPKDDPETVMEELESNLTTTLYLLTILTKLLKECSEEERFNVNRMVFTLNQLNVTLRDGQTLLHLACNAETPVDDFHTNDVCKFPCAETTRLLIKCGADVNAMDYDRNTPLHVIVNYHKPISDFLTLHSIITDLTEAGAHLDCVNKRGETPLEASATGSVAEIILKTQMKLSLKCIAANAVKHHKLTYQGQVPEALESFIELHGPGIVKKA